MLVVAVRLSPTRLFLLERLSLLQLIVVRLLVADGPVRPPLALAPVDRTVAMPVSPETPSIDIP